ncbi:MAG: hypothetical protein AAF495_01070 [Pseudomonadota bacterium]
MDEIARARILPKAELPASQDLLARGAALARDWSVGPSAFLDEVGEPSEAAYKRRQAAAGQIMQHAQIGYRDPAKSRAAYRDIYAQCDAAGCRVDRYGLCLDWSMGWPRAQRKGALRGTGMILEGPEAFVGLTEAAPVAPHFGDFVLGFPAALENTQYALAAGSTAIGNLGQYFTFRLPGWDDEVATTEATVTALGLIAAQETEVLVHSNLDDGFAAVFGDLACCLGAALLEQHIVERLIGAKLAHCYGHHFTEPAARLAFQRALAAAGEGPGTMLYGATVSYRGQGAANFASLASYLLVDIVGQRTRPSGHAINPVPITENQRIPDVQEVVEAQLFAARLVDHAGDHEALIDVEAVDRTADQLVENGKLFRDRVLHGLDELGYDTDDPFELLLALRRIGARRLEALFGPGAADPKAPGGRRPGVPATTFTELDRMAAERLAVIPQEQRGPIARAGLKALVATTDVHEHGKLLVERVLGGLEVQVIEGGVSCDPDDLADKALASQADLIAVSTYNGVALTFVLALKGELAARGFEGPLLIGGRLNQIPEGSNTSLPVEVGRELAEAGAVVCIEVEDAVAPLLALAQRP